MRSKTNRMVEKCSIGSECGEEWCFVTEYDINVNLVQCDTCDLWFHAMCEGIRPSQESSLSLNEFLYKCHQCTSVADDGCDVDRLTEFENLIASLVAEEDELNNQLVDIEREVDDMKAKYNKYSGPRDTALKNLLENSKVQRHAYHSNVIVGNPCVIVLERH